MHPFIYVDLPGLRVEGLHMLALHAGTLKAVTVSFSSTRPKETPGAWRYVLSRVRVARVLSFMALTAVGNVVQLGIEPWQNACTDTHSLKCAHVLHICTHTVSSLGQTYPLPLDGHTRT